MKPKTNSHTIQFLLFTLISIILLNQCQTPIKNNAKPSKVLRIEKLIRNINLGKNNNNIIFPPKIDTIIANNKGYMHIRYEDDSEWLDSIKNNFQNPSLVRIFGIDSLSSTINIDFDDLDKRPSLYYIEYNYKNKKIVTIRIRKDSLLNNATDSVACQYFTKKFFSNGQLKEIGCTTSDTFEASMEVPVDLHSHYDSIGNLTQTVFYHVNTIDKAYKIITQYDKGKIISKIKTQNDMMYEILPDTLEIIFPK